MKKKTLTLTFRSEEALEEYREQIKMDMAQMGDDCPIIKIEVKE